MKPTSGGQAPSRCQGATLTPRALSSFRVQLLPECNLASQWMQTDCPRNKVGYDDIAEDQAAIKCHYVWVYLVASLSQGCDSGGDI